MIELIFLHLVTRSSSFSSSTSRRVELAGAFVVCKIHELRIALAASYNKRYFRKSIIVDGRGRERERECEKETRYDGISANE